MGAVSEKQYTQVQKQSLGVIFPKQSTMAIVDGKGKFPNGFVKPFAGENSGASDVT